MQKVIYMFYPIDWQRHVFDDINEQDISSKVKELKAEFPEQADDIKFMPWGEVEEWSWSEVGYDMDYLNDWDDTTDDEQENDLYNIIEGTDLTKEFVMNHWCYAITEDIMNDILK